jgi:glycosyltransferase involved in cell wall biosynthesis
MSSGENQKNDAISVVIRTFNSAKTLRQALALFKLADGDEIIIVDSGSIDHTLTVAGEWQTKIIKAPGKFHYSKSLNMGFAVAGNSWVLVLRSHAIPQVPDMLAIWRQEMKKFPPDVVAAYGDSSITGQSTQNQNSLWYMFKKGVRDVRADSRRPMPVWKLGWGLTGTAKKILCRQINWSNYIRVSAHIMGQFGDSYAKQKIL